MKNGNQFQFNLLYDRVEQCLFVCTDGFQTFVSVKIDIFEIYSVRNIHENLKVFEIVQVRNMKYNTTVTKNNYGSYTTVYKQYILNTLQIYVFLNHFLSYSLLILQVYKFKL